MSHPSIALNPLEFLQEFGARDLQGVHTICIELGKVELLTVEHMAHFERMHGMRSGDIGASVDDSSPYLEQAKRCIRIWWRDYASGSLTAWAMYGNRAIIKWRSYKNEWIGHWQAASVPRGGLASLHFKIKPSPLFPSTSQ